MTADTNRNRLIRIETRLCRLMQAMGVDGEGHPLAGNVVMDRETLIDLISALDLYLNLMDDHPSESEFTEQYDAAEGLFNRLIDIREKRWPSN